MESDKLRLFNTKLVERIVSMDEAALWNFMLENEERIRQMQGVKPYPKTTALGAYKFGLKHFKKIFFEQLDYYPSETIYTLILDLCFEDAPVELEYISRAGYFDSPASCDVKTSDDIMPGIDEGEDPDEYYRKKYFHLLEPIHLEGIIRAMEENFDKLEKNTRKDINKIKKMKKFCEKTEGYNVAYIYDVY